jgi:hypothetical protein
VTVGVLPDDTLLCVFDCYVAENPGVGACHALMHVCRQWRKVVFGSPRRLNLRLLCSPKSPVRKKLDVWPAWPIILSGDVETPRCLDNVKAALEHNDRVCEIRLLVTWKLEVVFAALEKPFPALTNLALRSFSTQLPVHPDQFLGGSTHLQSFALIGITFSELPKPLLSYADLVNLFLRDIHCLYIPPETIFTILTSTNLERCSLGFKYHQGSQSRCPPTPTHAILPTLTYLEFQGVSEYYLEELLAWIDAPLLDYLKITFFNQIIFDTPQLVRFVSCIPKLQTPSKARIGFGTCNLWIEFFWPTRISIAALRLGITCISEPGTCLPEPGAAIKPMPDQQFPYVAQFCRPPFFPLPTLEHLYIRGGEHYLQQHQHDDIENTRWLDLFQPFTMVKNLYLSKIFAPRIAPALQELVKERATEVLPTLQNIFIEEFEPSGPVHVVIGQFVAAREFSRYPVVISHWDRQGDVC